VHAAAHVVDHAEEVVGGSLGGGFAGNVLECDFPLEVDETSDFLGISETLKTNNENGTVLVDAHELVSVGVRLAGRTPPSVCPLHPVRQRKLFHAGIQV
jgi:hypothetical protein